MSDTWIEIFGFIAAFLTTVSFLPQVIQTIKTKNTDSISFFMYLLFVIGVLLWTIYGFAANLKAVYIANIITLLLSSIILGYKIKSMIKRKGKNE